MMRFADLEVFFGSRIQFWRLNNANILCQDNENDNCNVVRGSVGIRLSTV